ncbi:MAG: hypothetical protein ABSC11_00720 [Smithella sp.]
MKKIFIAAIAVVMLIVLAAVPVCARNVIEIGKDINIGEEQAVDNAIAIAGQITVSGLVENNVVTLGGSIVLARGAVVRGNVVCIGGVVAQGNGAQIFGDITEVNSSNIFTALSSAFQGDTNAWSWFADIIYFCFFAMLLTLALLMAVLFPRLLNAIADSIHSHKGKSFLWGALGTLMIAPFFMLLIFSFVGIPLIPLVFSVILLSFMFGFIAVSALLGKFILTKTFPSHKHSLVRETLLGLILWWIIGWAPFYVGMLIKAVVITIGFGGVLLALFYRGYHFSSSGNNHSIAGSHIESTDV